MLMTVMRAQVAQVLSNVQEWCHRPACCGVFQLGRAPCLLALLLSQVINWLLRLGEGGPTAAGFRDAGFERFERLWTGQQVGCRTGGLKECVSKGSCLALVSMLSGRDT